jgi:hypothetical protein
MPGHPAWNIIDSEVILGSQPYQQILYWHQVGSAETGGPMFEFTFGDTPVRAAFAASTYKDTCLNDPTPCASNGGSPIFASTFGVSTGLTSQVTETSAISAPGLSIAVGAFGTTDTNSAMGETASNPPGAAGGFANQGGGFNMSPVTATAGNNGGIAIADLAEPFAGTDGPWRGSLPQLGKFPQIQLLSISSDGTTITGTTSGAPMLAQYGQPSFSINIVNVTGGSPSGCFNQNGVTITPTGSSTFTAPAGTCNVPSTGTTTGASIDIIDPGVGNNVAQVVTIIPTSGF